MRKTLTVILLLTTAIAFSQSITENEVDDFTGSKKVKTSWEVMSKNMKFSAFYRFSKFDDRVYLDLKMMLGTASVFSIKEGAKLMLKMSNGEVIEFINTDFAVTCKGCGARGFAGSSGQGLQTLFSMQASSIPTLLEHEAVKVRIYTGDGYVEHKVTPKNAETLKKSLKLVM